LAAKKPLLLSAKQGVQEDALRCWNGTLADAIASPIRQSGRLNVEGYGAKMGQTIR
jgi:hypothetical protein